MKINLNLGKWYVKHNGRSRPSDKGEGADLKKNSFGPSGVSLV